MQRVAPCRWNLEEISERSCGDDLVLALEYLVRHPVAPCTNGLLLCVAALLKLLVAIVY
jgi:hypothetical protein